MTPRTVTKKALLQCGGDTSSCPSPYPTAACPEFYIGCRLGRELFTLLVCYYWCPSIKKAVTPAPVRILTLRPLVNRSKFTTELNDTFTGLSLRKPMLDQLHGLLNKHNVPRFLVLPWTFEHINR